MICKLNLGFKSKSLGNFKNKLGTYLIFTLFLSFISFSFLIMIFYEYPDYDLIDKSYNEKMEKLEFFYYDMLIFINESTEEDSTILLFDGSMHGIAKNFLYPYRTCEIFLYDGNDDNRKLLNFLDDNECDYIYYYDKNYTLFTNNPALFERIESKTHVEYFLFEINNTRLGCG